MNYDVLIIGAGPGGIFSAYELTLRNPNLKIGVFEAGHPLNKRKCPINGTTVKSCIGCKSCSIMSGFGGAGAFSDGKYNITNDFGGTLYEYIGKKRALELMHYVDEINMAYGVYLGGGDWPAVLSHVQLPAVDDLRYLLGAKASVSLGKDVQYGFFYLHFQSLDEMVTNSTFPSI